MSLGSCLQSTLETIKWAPAVAMFDALNAARACGFTSRVRTIIRAPAGGCCRRRSASNFELSWLQPGVPVPGARDTGAER